jgi:phosphoglycerol transferase MdoB-like AlkP superfamily enzyme
LTKDIAKRFNNWKHLALHLLSILMLYGICRWMFYSLNQATFPSLTIQEIATLSYQGLRFDIAAIAAINIIYIAAYLFPIKQTPQSIYNNILKWLFTIFNFIPLLFEVSDWIYFRYNKQRANAEILQIIFQPSDFLQLLPSFLQQYWYIFLIAIILFITLLKLYNYIEKRQLPNLVTKNYLIAGLIWILGIGISILGIRGGFQLIPVNIRDAILVTDNKTTSIVLNTPFSIIGTFQNDAMPPVQFMDAKQANAIIQPHKQFNSEADFLPKNICIIVLESFSKEFTKLSNTTSYSPFLDSLMDHSLVFDNAFANALHSAQGIPAITAGIPGILPQAFSMSPYANNTINSFASLLKPLQYNSTFYHGATNGSFSFDIFAKNAGYDRYIGRKEYNNEADFDGTWGIWDEPFLQFVAKDITAQKQPFINTIFTINSHNPYTIPQQYESILPATPLPIQRAVSYTDLALREFFRTIATNNWYNNTLFIITADHASSIGSNHYYQDQLGKYQIPILFFDPSQTVIKSGTNHLLMQQIDILPSILQLLHFKAPFYALGNSVFDSLNKPFVLAKQGENYTYIQDSIRLQLANHTIQAAYSFPKDSTDLNNLINDQYYSIPNKNAHKNYQALMQVFTHDLINNKMFIDK